MTDLESGSRTVHWLIRKRDSSCIKPRESTGRAMLFLQSRGEMNEEAGSKFGRSADAARQRVRAQAQAYQRVLSGAGGRELELLERGDEDAMVCAGIYLCPPYDLQVPALSVARLSVNLTRSTVSGGIEGEAPRRFEAQRHSLFLLPAGAPVCWRKDSPSRHVTIYFRPGLLDEGDGDPPLAGATAPLFNATMPGIGALADQLAEELESTGLHRVEAADSLARLLLIRFDRHLRRSATCAGRLTPALLARLKEYVLAHLGERILVADLARQVGLSPNRFALGFSEQTGRSPHRWVLDLRVERAAELLGRSRLSLAEVADACGFSSQQHLSNALRRQLGATPGQLRARHREPG